MSCLRCVHAIALTIAMLPVVWCIVTGALCVRLYFCLYHLVSFTSITHSRGFSGLVGFVPNLSACMLLAAIHEVFCALQIPQDLFLVSVVPNSQLKSNVLAATYLCLASRFPARQFVVVVPLGRA